MYTDLGFSLKIYSFLQENCTYQPNICTIFTDFSAQQHILKQISFEFERYFYRNKYIYADKVINFYEFNPKVKA